MLNLFSGWFVLSLGTFMLSKLLLAPNWANLSSKFIFNSACVWTIVSLVAIRTCQIHGVIKAIVVIEIAVKENSDIGFKSLASKLPEQVKRIKSYGLLERKKIMRRINHKRKVFMKLPLNSFSLLFRSASDFPSVVWLFSSLNFFRTISEKISK